MISAALWLGNFLPSPVEICVGLSDYIISFPGIFVHLDHHSGGAGSDRKSISANSANKESDQHGNSNKTPEANIRFLFYFVFIIHRAPKLTRLKRFSSFNQIRVLSCVALWLKVSLISIEWPAMVKNQRSGRGF